MSEAEEGVNENTSRKKEKKASLKSDLHRKPGSRKKVVLARKPILLLEGREGKREKKEKK